MDQIEIGQHKESTFLLQVEALPSLDLLISFLSLKLLLLVFLPCKCPLEIRSQEPPNLHAKELSNSWWQGVEWLKFGAPSFKQGCGGWERERGDIYRLRESLSLLPCG